MHKLPNDASILPGALLVDMHRDLPSRHNPNNLAEHMFPMPFKLRRMPFDFLMFGVLCQLLPEP